ncbi:MAG: pseudouridine synthase [Candidatus Saccharibacteria bacterium]|nr:pseudouridine synthase [Candidatus Saccharibacteria bacterium]
MTRLNKHIARILGISRREADSLIDEGRVTVDGKVAQLGEQPDEGASIVVDKQEIDKSAAAQLIAFHKPVGYVCSRKQQGDNPTIYDLLPPELQQLKTVGRLDRDSSGIILLTNDGDFAHTMTHPSFSKIKIYEVELDKPLQPLHQQMISDHGIELEDGTSKFMIEKLDKGYKITMKEGRNRQIRRTFDSLGYAVTKLHRIQFGNYLLGDLEPKKWQEITIT